MTTLSRWTRGLTFAAGVLFMTGCHTYIPTDSPPPGSIARIRIPVQSVRANPNAPLDTESVEGQVVAAGDTVVLAIQTRRETGAYREIILYDTLRMARSDLSSIELREFSRGRSVALGVVLAGGVTALALAALGIQGGEAGAGPGDGGSEGAVVSKNLVQLVWRLIGG